MNTNIENLFKSKVLGHPVALFVLFFTEMWERFSYYGMRALLVMFFTASILDEGWGWPREWAFAIFGTYASLVYLSTMLGGYFADNIIGIRKAVVIGALLMTLGHGAMAFESPFFVYTGLSLLVLGSGFFKPNMTSIISEMYTKNAKKKDGAYTIFYMGVNAGAFLGILLCGYLGEKIGWSLGFGVAGIFMLFGLLQFWLIQDMFGEIGKKPKNKSHVVSVKGLSTESKNEQNNSEKRNPFTVFQKTLISLCSALGLLWIFNDPISKISEGKFNFFPFELAGYSGATIAIILAFIIFVTLLIIRIPLYEKIIRDRMLAVVFFAFITIFFWAVFEQSPSSLTIFAKHYTRRILEGNASLFFKIFNTVLVVIPLLIINGVLYLLVRKTFKKYLLSNLILILSFVVIWIIAYGMLRNQLSEETTEIPASWFSLLNNIFIITMAPLFSKWWESKYNPNANIKWAIGMLFLGLGMVAIALGASGIEPGARTASVSIIWLILVYFFHTMGELCVSPVALSYVSKLVPGRMIAFMFGIWYLAVAIGMKLAGVFAETSEAISKKQGISNFFWLLTFVSFGFAVISVVLQPLVKKLMHGIK
ncbi:MAG: peptide MFS transporter [Tenacibaculum sp.]